MAKTKKKIKKKIIKSKKKSVGTVKPEKPAVSKPEITPYPVAGSKVQEFENVLDAQLAGDVPKRPVGRPPNPPEPEPPELTIDIVAGVVKIPFELWSIGQDVKGLALTDEEAKQMAEPARQLLEYYLPKIPVIAYAWVGLSVSSFWVMRTRLLLIQEIKKQRQKQQPARPAEPAQPGVTTSFPQEIKTEKI